ncbi:putative outer membrane lipoprotein, SmpA/OmlA family [Cupriavidus taiwanensis]|uniref:Outer membrane protein assembly factor BamE n=1 Tax=Cupriavidus taiwanensis TaxID=164546 RepID=A0A375E175_9BURK|nr:outer membrane protein assembly factor BamE [Cupriavidus taiwanensis]SOZ14157.1 putative outer membrane lipoprotein, SmpA/OmlA family [Cupriavidus taiwanensis]SOZ25522.1 putative outer membrane lipoprotein, SmpA/OmlA family [Cupriavidus taiwanensis]SOZ44773.1 putative outer membrane lipoprotein, SmpA/OmlA family [Cupriavidus taiwanensis]SOZ55747.1 putative outer membrane lipoprotein, SmpA/OmlA family [Cupriavidus taiwanensis]SOZ57198.1 putative outer membrane lipoprotein, SmpA/OmlA family [
MRSIRSSAMRPTLVVSLLAAALLAGACSAYDSTSRKVANAITPYRINIVQGNFVSREAASQLREGMTRDQVKFLLGTPLLTDVFHANRWDYVFSFRRGNTSVVQQRRYTVFFDGDRLVKFGGDELPSEYELIAEIDGMKKALKEQTPGKISTSAAATPAEQQTTVENFVPRQAQQPEASGAPAQPAQAAQPAAEASAPAQATAPADAPKPAAN